MLRSIGAVIAGYATMFIVAFVTFSIAYLAMGADGAFQPGSYEVSMVWIAVSFVLGLAAAVAGGFVCAAIAKGSRAPAALAILVLVLGLLMAIPVMMAAPTEQVRGAEVGNLEAMGHARQPVWVALLNPFVGAIGTMMGARLKGA